MPSKSRGDFASAASAPLMRLVFERLRGGRRPLCDRPRAVAFVSADRGSAVSTVNTIQQAAAARAGKRSLRTISGRTHGQQSSACNALIFLRKGTKITFADAADATSPSLLEFVRGDKGQERGNTGGGWQVGVYA
jgi:hypothetical protein